MTMARCFRSQTPKRNKNMAASTGPPTTPSTAAPAATTSTAGGKVPKSLSPGNWTMMVNAYQNQQIGGKDRIFPTVELLGTESVLARIVHENEISKNFTPVLLGELISLRTFLPTGEPNPLSKKDRSSTKLQLSGETLTAAAEEPWQPRSVLAIMDGLNSIRWAYILCSVGSEQSVHEFIDWAIRLARSRPQKTEQFTQYWLTGWKLATMMRAGKTFDESALVLVRDYDSFSECMAREPSQPKRATAPNNDQDHTSANKHLGPTPAMTRPTGHGRNSHTITFKMRSSLAPMPHGPKIGRRRPSVRDSAGPGNSGRLRRPTMPGKTGTALNQTHTTPAFSPQSNKRSSSCQFLMA